ncbi:MAG: hypothetical protein FWF12_03245 [Betaproteobacteria bacterium]|nr:hypothetical protein [Betaproteobacteria bacterium]
MKISTLFTIGSISSALFACSTPSSPPTPSSSQGQINHAVRQAIERNNVIEESVLRNGEKVFLAVRLLEPSKNKAPGELPGELYLQASCDNGSADWIFADLVDKKISSIRKERHYADRSSLYSPPLALNESTAKAVHQLDAVKNACERTPSWREIAYNKKNETQLLLEISSLQTQPDGSVRFWAAVDYPYLAYIRLYKAPYARRAGFYQVDCQKQSYSLLHVYYLDQQQTVTDGGMQTRQPVLNIPQATGDSAAMLSMICSGENLSQILLPPEPRDKRLPNFSALPDPDANIATQLTQLERTPPIQSVNAIRMEGARSSLSGSALTRLNKPALFRQEVLIEPTSIPGVFYVTWQEGNDRMEQMSFLGMIPLSQMLYSAEEQNVFQVDKLELRGDWEKMPVNSQLGYWQRTRITDIVTNQSNRELEVICKVAREISAEELHRQFQGKAKELKCHVVGGKLDEISTYYYLEDYGFCLLLGSRSDKYILDSRVTQVR